MICVVVGVFALSLAVGFGQDDRKAQFFGRWKMDPARSDSAHQAVPIGAMTVVIKQTANELIIETMTSVSRNGSAAQTESVAYRLDGLENTVTTPSGGTLKTRARWDGPKLVTETVRNINGVPVTMQHVLSVRAGGKQLTIDRTLTVQHGYQSPSGNNTGAGKDVFVRTSNSSRK